MLKDYIQASQKRVMEQVSNFYTSTGIHVYFKDQMLDDSVDIEKVVSSLESRIPSQLLSEVEMIIIGHFEEFEERELTAFFRDGALYISNVQMDEDGLLEDMIHETAHAVEIAYGQEIYADAKIKDEFLRKREHLYNLLWSMEFKAPKNLFMDPEYNFEFDEFLLKDVGYDKLSKIISGLYINPYAPTSLQEYFATGFAEFYMHPNDHSYLKQISPALYRKLEKINNIESLDT